MHLNDRAFERFQRVVNGDRSVGESPGIDDDPGGPLARRVYPVDQLVLGVALSKRQFKPNFGAERAGPRFDVGEGLVSVDRGLALAEQIQIWAIQNENMGGHLIFSPGSRRWRTSGLNRWLRQPRQNPRVT